VPPFIDGFTVSALSGSVIVLQREAIIALSACGSHA